MKITAIVAGVALAAGALATLPASAQDYGRDAYRYGHGDGGPRRGYPQPYYHGGYARPYGYRGGRGSHPHGFGYGYGYRPHGYGYGRGRLVCRYRFGERRCVRGY